MLLTENPLKRFHQLSIHDCIECKQLRFLVATESHCEKSHVVSPVAPPPGAFPASRVYESAWQSQPCCSNSSATVYCAPHS